LTFTKSEDDVQHYQGRVVEVSQGGSMFEYSSGPETPSHTPEPRSFSAIPRKRLGTYAAIAVLGGSLGAYGLYEHNKAQVLESQNVQANAALGETRHELMDLTTKVNTLVARGETQPAPEATPAAAPSRAPREAHAPVVHVHHVDPRYAKLQSQLDAQGKQIEETRNAIDSTRGDLANTRTELTGSIAHTHDELVLLQKKGERNYTEFDIYKAKEFQHKGPFGVRLKKANVKHQYADLELIVDDRNLSQKHVNLFQPVMFYTPDAPQPVEVVINEVSKDHIHGYISASKYGRAELASMANTPDPSTQTTAASTSDQPPVRKKLTVPQ
jgi:hypothetical protein